MNKPRRGAGRQPCAANTDRNGPGNPQDRLAEVASGSPSRKTSTPSDERLNPALRFFHRLSAVGHLGWDASQLQRKLPQVIERLLAFVEENFRSEFFVSPQTIDAESQERLERVLRPVATLLGPPRDSAPSTPAKSKPLL